MHRPDTNMLQFIRINETCKAVLQKHPNSHLVRQPPSVMSKPSCWFATSAWLDRLTPAPDRGGAAENQASR